MSTAIITGGSRGLGLALAAELSREGWWVVVDGRNADALGSATAGLGSRCRALAGDVNDGGHRRDLVRAAAETGRLDLLVNNASTLGVSPLPRLAEYDLDVLEAVYRTNVLAPLALVQAALPMLRESGGAVLSISSDAAVEAYPGWGGYGSSKSALDQLSAVLGEEEPDVRVWAFDPGDMRTQMHQDAFPGEDISDRPEPQSVVPAVRQLLAARPPSGRVRASELLPVPA